MIPPGLVISAPASGTGKTTVTLGLLRALARAGVAVQPYKCGPDYIDPAFHTAASGRASVNLDAWAMDAATLMSRAGREAEIVLAEGAMGLFDGVAKPGEAGTGASADIAALMGWPVVLVVDVSGAAQTAAMVARGVQGFREGVTLAGVILNRVASPRHEALVRDGMDRAVVSVLGALPRRSEIAMPERHLGLVQAGEQAGLPALLDDLADLVEEHVDIAALRAAAASSARAVEGTAAVAPPPGQRIALARDAAFSFVYPHLIDGWRDAGAEVLPFSPLADEAPDGQADCVWMPGGYPELHGATLAAAETWRAGMQAFDGPIHGECGGYMALGEALVDRDGTAHRMAGRLGLVTSYAKRKMHLGYRSAALTATLPGFAQGARLRGHEFHYSTIVEQPDAPLAEVTDATGATVPETGSVRGRVSGTFFHLIGEARA
ncbi:cobyrinate a,c-diamide synthase [Pseudaestuariivita atlantica]|uniref:Hydrogenobyrinate a,c-diamide synthase n=1 Tax=Pseudaestuariivita atlantica TaxID=1317121 RepID=A0A0L1JQM3_9RHOB|nr:cobyrinate a,c-diamide synthase [Pseudaestuariivita atlantica]KNG94030.1 cobyrinic acid a,c-diamide synthase [Pseudaestuariivita atlantica]